MKNIIKKISSVAFVMFAVMGITGTASATDAYWNNHPQDLSFIQSKIFTDPSNPGSYTDNTYNAAPGQVIAVRLYYHNTGTGPATNTTFTMTRPTGTSTSHTISGTLSADGTNTDSGSTTISLTSAQTLTYVPGSLRFYRYNQYSTATPVSGDGSQIFNGGLNVGTIPGMDSCRPENDFCEQGVVAVAFKVGSDVVNNQYQCNDRLDNDGDGYTDYPNDPGCTSYTDNDETNYIDNQYCQISTFYASPSTVTYGGYTTLYWSTSNCDYVEIDGVRYNTSGNGSFGPIYTGRNYELKAWRSNQTPVYRSTYVTVNTINNTTYVCSDNYDNDSDGFIDAQDPGCYTNGSYDRYKNSEYNTVSSLYQCNDGRDNDGDGYTDYPNDPGCYGYTDDSEYNTNQVINTLAVTTLNPTELTATSARINGSVVNPGTSSNVYFEWGTNATNLSQTTTYQSTSANSTITFYDTLRGLTTNTTYYYRAVAQNSSAGTVRGEVKSFRLVSGITITQPTTIIRTINVPTPVVQGVTIDRGIVLGLGTNLVQLRYINTNTFNTLNNSGFGVVQANVNNAVQNICVAETASFTVEYRNISNVVLNNAILHIDIPKDLDFRSSSAGVYNKADNTITVNVGTLTPDQSGTVTFSGVVLESAANRDLLVVPATLSFETPNNGARETAIAYGLATTQNCLKDSNLGSFAFGAGFFPNTLIGWLILLLILVLLAYLVRRWYMLNAPAKRGNRTERYTEKYYEDMDVPTAPYKH